MRVRHVLGRARVEGEDVREREHPDERQDEQPRQHPRPRRRPGRRRGPLAGSALGSARGASRGHLGRGAAHLGSRPLGGTVAPPRTPIVGRRFLHRGLGRCRAAGRATQGSARRAPLASPAWTSGRPLDPTRRRPRCAGDCRTSSSRGSSASWRRSSSPPRSSMPTARSRPTGKSSRRSCCSRCRTSRSSGSSCSSRTRKGLGSLARRLRSRDRAAGPAVDRSRGVGVAIAAGILVLPITDLAGLKDSSQEVVKTFEESAGLAREGRRRHRDRADRPDRSRSCCSGGPCSDR